MILQNSLRQPCDLGSKGFAGMVILDPGFSNLTPGPEAWKPLRGLLEIQSLRPYPRVTKSEPAHLIHVHSSVRKIGLG